MPRVSVIMPTYNRAHLIGFAIDSVLAQTYRDFEIIVVDDGSTDNTREVLSIYRDRITYIFQENAGPSTARNRGIQVATGEFLTFLDSDDTISPTKLELQVAYLEAHPDIEVVYSGWQIISEDGGILQNEVRPAWEGDLLKDLLLEGYLFPIHAPLIRHNCIDQVGLFDESLPAFEDPDLWIRIAQAGYRYGCLKEPLCQWRITSGSLGKNQPKLEQGVSLVLKKVFSDPGLSTDIAMIRDEVYARRYLSFALNYYYASNGSQEGNERNIAYQYVSKVLSLKPTILVEKPYLLDSIVYKALELSPTKPDAHIHSVMSTLLSLVREQGRLKSQLLGRLHITQAFQAYRAGRRAQLIAHILQGIRHDPSLFKNRGVISILLKSSNFLCRLDPVRY